MDNFEYEVTACEAHTDSTIFLPKNPLNRPSVHYRKPIIAFIGLLFLVSISYCSMLFVSNEMSSQHNRLLLCTIVSAIVGGVYCCIILKKTIIWFVHFYQHYASDKTRLKCVYEPSCSEYMILAINKYGVFRGLFKGIKRLLRCHPPGGIDYP